MVAWLVVAFVRVMTDLKVALRDVMLYAALKDAWRVSL